MNKDESIAYDEAIEERAAIREYDGEEDRESAERSARAEMHVYRYLLDGRDLWATVVTSDADAQQAKKSLAMRYPGRVIEVVEMFDERGTQR